MKKMTKEEKIAEIKRITNSLYTDEYNLSDRTVFEKVVKDLPNSAKITYEEYMKG